MKEQMELSETRRILIEGLTCILTNKDVILAIVLMLRSEGQMMTMIDWLLKHGRENPSEDLVIAIARAIQEKIE